MRPTWAESHGERIRLRIYSPKERMRTNRRIAELLKKLGTYNPEKSTESTNDGNDLSETQNMRSMAYSETESKADPDRHDEQESGIGSNQDPYELAAFMLGNAMLEKIGIPNDINPIAVVVTLLQRMENEDSMEQTEGAGSRNDVDEAVASAAAPKSRETQAAEMQTTSGRNPELPRPIRGSIGEAPETDYFGMSSEDFRNLREKLIRASREGRRIRI